MERLVPATGEYLLCHTGTLALTVHVVMLGRDRCPGVPTSDFAVCLSVCLCVCVCTWSIVRSRPYVYIVGLHLPQGAPAYVGSDNA